MSLIHLNQQIQFEEIWFHTDMKKLRKGMRESDGGWLLYHTASWCGPCKRIRFDEVVKAAEKRGLTVWKIDVDVNDYTSGFCGVRTIPTFQFCVPRKIVSTLQSSDTEKITEWIMTL